VRVLDLYSCAGGATMGMIQAWPEAHVTGVDVKWQKNYCGHDFIQGDALAIARRIGRKFDFIWASPPCQAYCLASLSHRMNGKDYPDLIEATRKLLLRLVVPFVIENVPKAPIRRDLMLCGSMFGLKVVRHRHFEMSFKVPSPGPCNHGPDTVTVCGHGTPSWCRRYKEGHDFTQQEKRDAMGVNWTNRGELAEAIPPAYSRYIAEQYSQSLVVAAGAAHNL